MNHDFAEQHQVDPDEAARDAAYQYIEHALFWLGVGVLLGSLVTCVGAYVWSFFL